MITAQRLRKLLHYDPETGAFRWRISHGRQKAGSTAGTISGGYVVIRIDGIAYGAHRLAWLYMTGTWPKHQVDHRDRDKANNRFGNLRAATPSQNRANIGASNGLAIKGVRRHRSGYSARIGVGGKTLYLGTFDTADEAANAYAFAARDIYGEFARL